MSTTISITEDNVLAALRGFLLGIVAAGVEVITGQDNLVPEPLGDDFIVMTALFMGRLSTASSTYTDPGTNPGTRNFQQSMKIALQLDIHGPMSANNTAMISTLFNSDYGVDTVKASGFDISPLYSDDGKQMPFTNGENQYEQRWIINAVMQYNPVTSVAQDFIDELEVNIINVDAAYPG